MVLRRAAPQDYLSLGRVYCLSWQEGYKHILPKAFLDSLTAENCAPKPENINSQNNYVTESDGEIVGLVNYGSSRDEASEKTGELRSIYVLPDFWGKGVGADLFRAVSQEFDNAGFDGFYLWVLKDNHRARRFYEKMGMTHTGEERETSIAGQAFSESKYVLKRQQTLSQTIRETELK